MQPNDELGYTRLRQNLKNAMKKEKQERKIAREVSRIKRSMIKHERKKSFFLENFTLSQLEIKLATLEAKQEILKGSVFFFLGIFLVFILAVFGEEIKDGIIKSDVNGIIVPLIVGTFIFILVTSLYVYNFAKMSFNKEVLKLSIKEKAESQK